MGATLALHLLDCLTNDNMMTATPLLYPSSQYRPTLSLDDCMGTYAGTAVQKHKLIAVM